MALYKNRHVTKPLLFPSDLQKNNTDSQTLPNGSVLLPLQQYTVGNSEDQHFSRLHYGPCATA